MEFSIKFNTVKSGWSIVYIESDVIISKKILYFFLRRSILTLIANSADPGDKLHHILTHLKGDGNPGDYYVLYERS